MTQWRNPFRMVKLIFTLTHMLINDMDSTLHIHDLGTSGRHKALGLGGGGFISNKYRKHCSFGTWTIPVDLSVSHNGTAA